MRAFFESLVSPCEQLMQRLRLALKFAIISTAFLIPLAVAVYGVVSYADDNIEFARQEQLGVAYVEPLNDLLAAMNQARGGGSELDAAFARVAQVIEDQND